MPLSAAERQRRRRQRIRDDPARELAEREKDRKRWHQRKAAGSVKLVGDLSERDVRIRRRYWREDKRKKQVEKQRQNANTPPTTPPICLPRRRNVRRNNQRRIKLKMAKLQERLNEERRKSEMYRKRWRRAMPEASPRTKTMLLIRRSQSPKTKRALFQKIMLQQMRQRYEESCNEREKQAYVRICASKLIMRYRMMGLANEMLGISAKRMRSSSNMPVSKLRRTQVTSKRRKFSEVVESHYCSDETSRMLPGKKDCITKNMVKKQKRVLCETMTIVYSKFLNKYPRLPISYTLFCRMRPFWVIKPTARDRETCLCMTHENMALKMGKLHALKVVSSARVNDVLEQVTCDITSKSCMYSECNVCKDDYVPPIKGVDVTTDVSWEQWKSVKEQRVINGEARQLTVTKKIQVQGTIDQLFDAVNQSMPKFKRHQFTMIHQQTFYSKLRENLAPNDCMIHIDFSENYLGKSSREVQAAHFGASHRQVTLHTGVYFVGEHTQETFCTVSDNTFHGPSAVWCHLRPILQKIRRTHPHVTTVHFFSDGPTSQYKQRKNFFLFANLPYQHGFLHGKMSL